jgi:hypothetical protein
MSKNRAFYLFSGDPLHKDFFIYPYIEGTRKKDFLLLVLFVRIIACLPRIQTDSRNFFYAQGLYIEGFYSQPHRTASQGVKCPYPYKYPTTIETSPIRPTRTPHRAMPHITLYSHPYTAPHSTTIYSTIGQSKVNTIDSTTTAPQEQGLTANQK